MNIPKLYILLLSISLLCVQLQAQQKAHISLSSQDISKQGDSLHIVLMIEAKNIQLGSDQSLRLELNLKKKDKQYILPAIVYSGNKRYKYDRRNELLSDQSQLAKKLVYKTLREIDKNTIYDVDYKVTIPYQEWMDRASINVSQFFHDCCTQSLLSSQIIIDNINVKNTTIDLPQVELAKLSSGWNPNMSLCRQMVSILATQNETIKERSSTIEVQIDYSEGVYEVLPSFGNNMQQLAQVDTFMESVMNNELITLNNILIIGYASPEGSYISNEILATKRSASFKEYIMRRYELSDISIDTQSVAEDWEGLVYLLNKKPLPYTQSALDQINTYGIFEGREKKLMELDRGNPYRDMLKELFPQLRRIELKASYTIANISEQQASKLLYTHPELLSLEEIYRVANNCRQSTECYQLVYEIAAKTYPNDALANNNAAAACLMNGDTVSALFYLNKLNNNPIGYINRGVYHYMQGNMQEAESYLGMALQSENTRKQAEKNIALIKNSEIKFVH